MPIYRRNIQEEEEEKEEKEEEEEEEEEDKEEEYKVGVFILDVFRLHCYIGLLKGIVVKTV